jgi:hypothetical protein
MVNKCPSTFVPTHRLQTTNSEPWGLNLLWYIVSTYVNVTMYPPNK